MIKKVGVAAVLAAILFALPVSADEAPWDFGLPEPVTGSTPPKAPATDLFQALVGAYRDNSARTSVARCIFHVSCSHFAEKALSKYGLIGGGVVFIDRYFYRENDAARNFYPRIGEADGTYRLDDGPFVP